MIPRALVIAAACVAAAATVDTASTPLRARHGMVVAQEQRAALVGAEILRQGGGAIDAAVATAFALAVTFPAAGNIGGGGFLVYRPATGEPAAYDFRETAPAKASATMFLRNGVYDFDLHHRSHLSVGVPGTIAGLHLAWRDHGTLPWKRLVDPAIDLARDGFPVSDALAQSLLANLNEFKRHKAALGQFTKNGEPYRAGEVLRQPDLARTLGRIADRGPDGFYTGETALLIEKEMTSGGGLMTRGDLQNYRAHRRPPLRGTYRGFDVISMPPPTSGGTALIEMLNILEGYDLSSAGYGSAESVHLAVESMRRAYADRAQHLGDPDFNPQMPIARLVSKEYARQLRGGIDRGRASRSSPTSFEWGRESNETTHLSIVDASRNAVALTYTLEGLYGAHIVVPGAGFLLNNEMGDFNPVPGVTDGDGLIGTTPNLTQPGKRMLSSMTPTILARDGRLFMVTGTPGGRTIINTVLETILNVVDFGMNAQEAVDAARFHHQWLPDRIVYEQDGLSPDTLALLRQRGHELRPTERQGSAAVIVYNAADDMLEAGVDRRSADAGAGVVTERRTKN
jgi:gamma-glutamyltranspeptidase/glutathione hydrolase